MRKSEINSKKPFGLWYYNILNLMDDKTQALKNASGAKRRGNMKLYRYWKSIVKERERSMRRWNRL